jgi:vitamin B12 transporter
MRVGILIVVGMLTNLYCFAQQTAPTLLDSVEVYGIPDERFLAGGAFTSVDSALLRQQRSRHLGELLATQLPVYFRNYGQGMISGISLRGTAPQHTAVLWNGVNINSFSLGQADFSILPAAAFGSVKVHAGGSSARFGSGALGGAIVLTSPEASTQEIFHVTQEVGSFGQYFTEAGGSLAVKRWNFHTQLYHIQSDGDFKVIATGDRQQHAAFTEKGIIQDVAYNWSAAKSLSLHYWYHNSDREVQQAVGTRVSSDEQEDKNHRLSIQYKSASRHGQFTATGGYIRDAIVFRTESIVSRWISSVKHAITLPANVHLEVSAEWNHIRADIREYNRGGAKEDRFDFMASLQKNVGSRLALSLNLRQPTISGFSPPFLPYLGAEYSVLKYTTGAFVLRANASRNYRMPTLNDRYWQNAGDRNLKPELSYASEAGWRWTLGGLTVDNTWFWQEVDQWIQWMPNGPTTYYPKNIKHVRARGIELRANVTEQVGAVTITGGAGYQYTQSITTEAPANEDYTLGKQLIYTPVRTASGYVRAGWRRYTATATVQYSSKRYTDFSNADFLALDPYTRMDVSLGRAWLLKRHEVIANLAISNVFNTEYQQYAGRALPGRYYTLQVTYQLNSIAK